MFLDKLMELYHRIEGDLIPPYHKKAEIPWIIQLSEDGEFQGFVSTKGDKKGQNIVYPYIKRSGSGAIPFLLVDKPEYVLGIDVDERAGTEKTKRNHAAFVEFIEKMQGESPSDEVDAVINFLKNHLFAAKEQIPEGMKKGDLITFRIGKALPIESHVVQKYWEKHVLQDLESKAKVESECLLCGDERPIADSHPVELLLGPDRVQLVTANKKAFESYGLPRSAIAPMCFECANKYGMALRYLLNSDRHHLSIANTHHIFWTREPERDFNPMEMFTEPEPEKVQRLISAAYRARGVPDIDANAFYALSLTANTSRLVVRNWIETTVPEVKANLGRYFSAQRMVGPDGDDSPFPLRTLAYSLARKAKDIPINAENELLACALQNRPLSYRLLAMAVKRAKADEFKMTRPRAALLRLVMESHRFSTSQQEEISMNAELDARNASPPYLCGRLFAVLESVQKNAIPGINTTIADKYFGTACSAPASIFGTLLRTAQVHLSKLRRDEARKGAYYALDGRMQEIMEKLDGFPTTLSLTDQALFSLGYYQQKAADGRERKRHSEAKKNDNSSE